MVRVNEAVREMTFEEEYEILLKEKDKLFASEIEGDETPFANCVVRRALRCIRKLKERYLDAEEQGLLFRLPCKVGDRVYFIVNGSRIVEKEIWSFEVYENGRVYGVTDEGYCANFTKLLNTKVFLTKEEAEKTLESMKGE